MEHDRCPGLGYRWRSKRWQRLSLTAVLLAILMISAFWGTRPGITDVVLVAVLGVMIAASFVTLVKWAENKWTRGDE